MFIHHNGFEGICRWVAGTLPISVKSLRMHQLCLVNNVQARYLLSKWIMQYIILYEMSVMIWWLRKNAWPDFASYEWGVDLFQSRGPLQWNGLDLDACLVYHLHSDSTVKCCDCCKNSHIVSSGVPGKRREGCEICVWVRVHTCTGIWEQKFVHLMDEHVPDLSFIALNYHNFWAICES